MDIPYYMYTGFFMGIGIFGGDWDGGFGIWICGDWSIGNFIKNFVDFEGRTSTPSNPTPLNLD